MPQVPFMMIRMNLSIQLILLFSIIPRSFCQLQVVPNYTDCYVLTPSLIGDGNCDNFLPYNSEVCGYDGEDCSEFNTRFPNCTAPIPTLVTDGKCQNIFPYNTTECGNDGGDCIEFQAQYPNCYVLHTEWVGNGKCDDFAPYNTKECAYDGGDCTLSTKTDTSNRDVILSCGAILCISGVIAALSWESRRRRRVNPQNSDDLEFISDDDENVLKVGDKPMGTDEAIEILNLSPQQGDIEEAINLDIEMPVAPGRPDKSVDEISDIDDDDDSGPDLEMQDDDKPFDTEEASAPTDNELVDLGGDTNDFEETEKPDGADNDQKDLSIDLLGSDREDEDITPPTTNENENVVKSMSSDEDLIDLGDDLEVLEPEKPAADSDDEESDGGPDDIDSDDDKDSTAEDAGVNTEEEGTTEELIAKSQAKASKKIEEALRFLEQSESSNESDLSRLLRSSADGDSDREEKSLHSDSTDNAGNLTPTRANSFEMFHGSEDENESEKRNDDDGANDDGDKNDENEVAKEKRVRSGNLGLLSRLIRRHKKRLEITQSSSSSNIDEEVSHADSNTTEDRRIDAAAAAAADTAAAKALARGDDDESNDSDNANNDEVEPADNDDILPDPPNNDEVKEADKVEDASEDDEAEDAKESAAVTADADDEADAADDSSNGSSKAKDALPKSEDGQHDLNDNIIGGSDSDSVSDMDGFSDIDGDMLEEVSLSFDDRV